jgi:hypothetical protein
MKTNEEFISEIITKAESGKHQQFQFLRNWKEYDNAKLTRKALKLLISSIRKSSRRFFNKYCASVATDDTDVIKLLVYCTINKALKYYEEELAIVNEMIYEYEAYLMEGNLLWTWLFSEPRPIEKLWDHRGL